MLEITCTYLARYSVGLANFVTPVTSSYRNDGELSQGDGTSNRRSYLFGALHSETHMAVVVPNGNKGLSKDIDRKTLNPYKGDPKSQRWLSQQGYFTDIYWTAYCFSYSSIYSAWYMPFQKCLADCLPANRGVYRMCKYGCSQSCNVYWKLKRSGLLCAMYTLNNYLNSDPINFQALAE